ncbi:MAG: type IV pilus modification PilV family protein [Candidatus Methylomirabilis sp.]
MAERFTQTGRCQRILRDQRGFTAAELLAASVVIGIALLALLQTIPMSAYGIQEGSQQSTAVFLANERMEQVKNATWTAVPVADTLGVSASATVAPVNAAAVTTFPDESPMAAPYAGYTRQVRIRDCNVAPGCGGLQKPDMRQATVTVSYAPMTGVGGPAQGASKSVVVTMIIAEKCFRATAADPCT